MNRTHSLKLPKLLLGIALLLSTTASLSTEEPALLQKNAIVRIEAFIDHFRKTGDRQTRLADLERAEQELLSSQNTFARAGKLSEEAHSLVRLGQIQRMRGQWDAAIEYYKKAEIAAVHGKDTAMQAKALAGMAQAEISLPNLGAAEEHSAQAARLSEGLTDKKLRFDALDIAAQAQIAQTNFNAAVTLLNRAFTVAEGVDDESYLYYGYLDRADAYLKMAEKCDFQRTFEPCLQALEQSRTDYLEAQQIANKLGYVGLANMTAGFLRQLEVRKQMISGQQALDRTIRESPVFAPKKQEDVLVTEHFVYAGALSPDIEKLYPQFKEETQQYGGFADSSKARSSYIEGIIQQSQGKHDAAQASFLEAVKGLERNRGKLRDERDRGSFIEDKISFYYAAILQLLEHRRYTEAFDLLERSRARAMADLLASRPPGFTKPAELALYGEVMNLKARIADKQSKFVGMTGDSSRQAKQQLSAANAEIEQMESQLTKLTQHLSKKSPKLGELLNAATISLPDLQRAMQEENFEMLQYLVLEHAVILWHISAGGIHAVNVFIPRSQLQEKIRKFKDSITLDPKGEFDGQTARELYLYLIEPAKKWMKTGRLVIVPHEDLYSVPFHALLDLKDGRFLGETRPLTYAPSATVLLGLRKTGPIAGGKLLAAADPGLPAAEPEVDAIAKLYPQGNKVIKQPLASETGIKTLIGDYDLVHLAVHGKFVLNEPMLSHLIFSADGKNDGHLTAAEMFGLPLDKSKLVVLSACETARSEASVGNEVQGMLRALLYAGANSLIMSYWQVDSDATAQWMTSFYQAAQSRPPAEAAQQAMMAIKSQAGFSHPYYWAAFMTVGR